MYTSHVLVALWDPHYHGQHHPAWWGTPHWSQGILEYQLHVCQWPTLAQISSTSLNLARYADTSGCNKYSHLSHSLMHQWLIMLSDLFPFNGNEWLVFADFHLLILHVGHIPNGQCNTINLSALWRRSLQSMVCQNRFWLLMGCSTPMHSSRSL